ncbi:MAG TPA: hypothetical protein VLC08_03505 [Chitinolyticbacter sp.]|nr:hypothetical protein [Chitinolyticbacter sp.]
MRPSYPGCHSSTPWLASLSFGLTDDLPPRLPRLTENEAVVFR